MTFPQTRQPSGQATDKQAGVSENVAADILGHEKPRITYGLYSGGASMARNHAAIRLLKYPEPTEGGDK